MIIETIKRKLATSQLPDLYKIIEQRDVTLLQAEIKRKVVTNRSHDGMPLDFLAFAAYVFESDKELESFIRTVLNDGCCKDYFYPWKCFLLDDTSIHIAIEKGFWSTVEYLIEICKQEYSNNLDRLYLALVFPKFIYGSITQEQREKYFTLLYAARISLNVLTRDGSVLSAIIETINNDDVLKSIISKYPEPLAWDIGPGSNLLDPLHQLVSYGFVKSLEIALNSSANLQKRDIIGRRAVDLLLLKDYSPRTATKETCDLMLDMFKQKGVPVYDYSVTALIADFTFLELFVKQEFTQSFNTTPNEFVNCAKFKTKLGWELLRRHLTNSSIVSHEKRQLELLGVKFSVFDYTKDDDYKFITHTFKGDDSRLTEMLASRGNFLNLAPCYSSASFVNKETPPCSMRTGELFPVQLVLDVPSDNILAAYPYDIGSPLIESDTFKNSNAQQIFFDNLKMSNDIEASYIASLQYNIAGNNRAYLSPTQVTEKYDLTKPEWPGTTRFDMYDHYPRQQLCTIERLMLEKVNSGYNELLIAPSRGQQSGIIAKAIMIDEHYLANFNPSNYTAKKILETIVNCGLPIILVKTEATGNNSFKFKAENGLNTLEMLEMNRIAIIHDANKTKKDLFAVKAKAHKEICKMLDLDATATATHESTSPPITYFFSTLRADLRLTIGRSNAYGTKFYNKL